MTPSSIQLSVKTIMGQKIHPLGLRLGISQPHRAKWCTTSRDYAYFILEDRRLREAVVEIANARQKEEPPSFRTSSRSSGTVPGSTAKPTAKPGSTAKPTAKPGSTAKPVAVGGRPSKPAAKPGRPAKPAAKPGRPAKPVAGGGVKRRKAKSAPLSKPSTDGQRRQKIASRLGPKANVQTMFHTSMFRKSQKDPVEISDIFIHRRRLHHDTDRTKGSLDVIEVYVQTTTPVQLIHGTSRASLTASVIRYQQALEKVASESRPAGAPRVRVLLNVIQVLKPKWTAAILASRLIARLEKRENFRSAQKRILAEALDKKSANPDPVDGVKIQISGRLNGAEIARTEWIRHGSVPLQTLRADLDYSYQTAKTTYGILGIKVWTYRKGPPRMTYDVIEPA
jgi:small subunit ribosomal protein S3